MENVAYFSSDEDKTYPLSPPFSVSDVLITMAWCTRRL